MSTRRTLCFTGMDAADEAALKDMFAKAASRQGGSWALVPEAEAEALVVDVDSLYGHMTWLKVHNSGKPIVALSRSDQADADFVLTRPVSVESLEQMLQQIERGSASNDAGAGRGAAVPSPRDARPAAGDSSADAVVAARSVPATAAAALQESAASAPPAPAAKAPVANAPAAANTGAPRAQAAAPAPAAAVATAPVVPAEADGQSEPTPQLPPRDPMLADYLEPGALPGPVRLKSADGPVLALDPQRQQYVGPPGLKPLIPACKRIVRREDWEAISPGELEKLKAGQEAQPWSRLLWLFALVNGEGQLAAGFDAEKKFRLVKWPQIEREYPKHFRIATVMMKQPATLGEVATSSGAPLAEVTDFVNAYLATGFAEMEEPPAPVDPNAQKAGFLGRLRGLRNG